MMTRQRLLAAVAAEILAVAPGRVARVAIDGVDGAGKTTFADDLAEVLAPAGRQVIRASVDDFHRPRRLRYARDGTRRRASSRIPTTTRRSPSGCWIRSVRAGRGASAGARSTTCASRPCMPPVEVAAGDAILLLDGIFLHRDELAGRWDHSVFLHVPFEVSIPRGAARDPGAVSPDPAAESNRRYVEGQRLYLRACEPVRRATTVIDNRDLGAPMRLCADASG